jgi:hypothetical protein
MHSSKLTTTDSPFSMFFFALRSEKEHTKEEEYHAAAG